MLFPTSTAQPVVDALGADYSCIAAFLRGFPGVTIEDVLEMRVCDFGSDVDDYGCSHGDEDEDDAKHIDELISQFQNLYAYLQREMQLAAPHILAASDVVGMRLVTIETAPAHSYLSHRFRDFRDVLANAATTRLFSGEPIFAVFQTAYGCCPSADNYQHLRRYATDAFPVNSILDLHAERIPDTSDARDAIRHLLQARDSDGRYYFRFLDITSNPVAQPDFLATLAEEDSARLVIRPPFVDTSRSRSSRSRSSSSSSKDDTTLSAAASASLYHHIRWALYYSQTMRFR